MSRTAIRVFSAPSAVLWPCLALALVHCDDGVAEGPGDETPDAGQTGVVEPGVEVLRPLELAENARVPESDPALLGVEVDGVTLRFEYAGPPAVTLEPGHVVAGQLGGGYLARLTSVTTEGNVVVATTEPAGLNQFIHDGRLRIETPPGVETRFEPVGDPDLGTVAQPLRGEIEIDLTDGRGFGCQPLAPNPPYEAFPVLVFELGATIELDIDGGSLEYFLFTVDAGLDMGADVEARGPLAEECVIDVLTRLFLEGQFLTRVQLPDINFSIGIIPVNIQQFVIPTLRVEGGVESELSELYAQGVASFGVVVGVEYVDGEWGEVFEPRRSARIGFAEDPTELGVVDLDVEVIGGARYAALFYGVAGPTFGVELGIRQQTALEPALCSWESSLGLGIDVTVGVLAELFGNTLADFEARFPVLDEIIATDGGTVGPSFGLPCDDLREEGADLCDNGGDDDYDGAVDCADRDCARPLGVAEWPCPTPAETTAAQCTDGADNDANGLTDCEDPQCEDEPGATRAVCPPPGEDSVAACDDDVDNDRDGALDCADEDCARPLGAMSWPCSGNESTFLACADRADNDGDRLIDCADSDCNFRPDEPSWPCAPPPEDTALACADEFDNDSDSFTDCDDPDCDRPIGIAAWPCPGPEESGPACADGVDNDGDTLTDCTDPDCANPGLAHWPCAPPPENTAATCGDTVDNDFDLLTDCIDSGCRRPLGVASWPCSAPEDSAVACADGADNDDDDDVDCADPDCAFAGVTPWPCPPLPENTAAACGDEADNDFDTFMDCADPDCSRPIGVPVWPCATPEDTAVACADGADNDNDGDVDCADPDCAYAGITPWPCLPPREDTADACGDEADNDFDSFADCADPDCARPLGVLLWPCSTPEVTAAACGDGADNDDDGDTDCADPDCAWPLGASSWPCFDTSESTPAFCADGADNDNDGLVDCADPDCTAPPGDPAWPCSECRLAAIGIEGCCAGSWLTYCHDGQLVRDDCGGAPACGWDDTRHVYNCETAGGADPDDNHPFSCAGLVACPDPVADVAAGSGYGDTRLATPEGQLDYEIAPAIGPILPSGDLLAISRDTDDPAAQHVVLAVHPDGSDSVVVGAAQYPPAGAGGRLGSQIVLDPEDPTGRAFIVDRGDGVDDTPNGRLFEVELGSGDVSTLVPVGLLVEPMSAAVHPLTHDVWIADRGGAADGDGQVVRYDRGTAQAVVAIAGFDPRDITFLDDGTLLAIDEEDRVLVAWEETAPDSWQPGNVFPYADWVARGPADGLFAGALLVTTQGTAYRLDASVLPYRAAEEIVTCGAARPFFGSDAAYVLRSNGGGGADDWLVRVAPSCGGETVCSASVCLTASVTRPVPESFNPRLAVGDFSGDGNLDVLAYVADGVGAPLFVRFDGNGAGGLASGVDFTAVDASSFSGIRAADASGDGIADVIVATGSGVDVYLRNTAPPHALQAATSYAFAVGGAFGTPALADVDLDELPDLIAINDDTTDNWELAIFPGQVTPPGTFGTVPELYGIRNRAQGLALGEVTDNFTPEILVDIEDEECDITNGFRLFENSDGWGDDTLEVFGCVEGLVVADVTGDGTPEEPRDDLLFWRAVDDEVVLMVHEQSGDPSFLELEPIIDGGGVNNFGGLFAGDIDGDLALDVAFVQDDTDGEGPARIFVAVHDPASAGELLPAEALELPEAYRSDRAGFGDFNGDGLLDIVTRAAFAGTPSLTLWLSEPSCL